MYFQNQQASKKKKKRKAESLLGAPFHLKDGDTVGIKVITKPCLFSKKRICSGFICLRKTEIIVDIFPRIF